MPAPTSKNRASQLMSELIRKIAEEQTEDRQGPNGEIIDTVSKAEALARIIWQMSLGWVETEDVLQNGVKIGTRIKRYPPAQWAIKEVLDRAEGKAATSGSTGDKTPDIADRIGDRTKQRLNALAEAEDLDKQDKIIPPIRQIPRHPRREGLNNEEGL